MIDPRARAVEQLLPGEQLLWVGQSDPEKMLGYNDRFLVPFSVLFSGFVVTGLVMAVRGGTHLAALIPLSILTLACLHLLVGRFVVKRHRKLVEVYLVTDRRAMVLGSRAVRETDARRTDRSVDWSGRHVSVSWDDTSDLDSLFWGGSTAIRQYANTGLDGAFGGRRDFAFYDVTDGEALTAALDRAS